MIEPLLAAGPNALTQSPTATALAVTDWVLFTGVELPVVMVSFCVLGVGGFLFLALLFELVDVGRRDPSESVVPDTVSFDPLTAVILPLAMERLASWVGKVPPPGARPENTRRVPPGAPPGKPPPTGNRPPPKVRVEGDPGPGPAHDPFDDGVVRLIERAAIVVFDFFEAVPVTLMQSPTTRVLTF